MKICAVDGCDGAVLAKGFCELHYWRNHRHGSPHARPGNDGEPLAWLKAHRAYQGDNCLTWPFARSDDGYGRLLYEGVIMGAHRAMCFEAHGEPPSRSHHAAHSCANGHLGCVNQGHLRWATPLENARDRRVHHALGMGSAKNQKLTEEQCAEIVRRRATESGVSLAKAFGVSTALISRIVNGTRRACLLRKTQKQPKRPCRTNSLFCAETPRRANPASQMR